MKRRLQTIAATIFILSTLQVAVHAQTNSVEVKDVDSNGQPLTGITVDLADGYACFNGITNQDGAVQFDLSGYELLILASDLSDDNRYGIQSYAPQYSATTYILTIPNYPTNERIAGQQIDRLLETLTIFHDVHSLHNHWPQSVHILNNSVQQTLGTPGLFSVSPIPRPMDDGRLGLHISGILVEPILRLSALIPGRSYVYNAQI